MLNLGVLGLSERRKTGRNEGGEECGRRRRWLTHGHEVGDEAGIRHLQNTARHTSGTHQAHIRHTSGTHQAHIASRRSTGKESFEGVVHTRCKRGQRREKGGSKEGVRREQGGNKAGTRREQGGNKAGSRREQGGSKEGSHKGQGSRPRQAAAPGPGQV